MSSSNLHMCVHPPSHVREVETHHHNVNPSIVICSACEGPISSGKVFNCSACNSNLHPLCKNRPRSLSAHVHPHHALSFRNQPTRPTRCNVCKTEIRGVSYTCPPCDFDAHPECSQLPLHVPCNNVYGRTGNPPHSLRLQLADCNGVNCAVCGTVCGRWAYSCDVCSVTIHYMCLVVVPHDPVDDHHPTSRSIRFGSGLGLAPGPAPIWGYCYYAPYNYPYGGQGYAVPNYNNYYHSNGSGFINAGNAGGGIGGSIVGFAARIVVGVLYNLASNIITSDFNQSDWTDN